MNWAEKENRMEAWKDFVIAALHGCTPATADAAATATWASLVADALIQKYAQRYDQ